MSSKDRPEEKKDLFAATGELQGVYDLSMARARALEHAQKSFGKTVKGKHIQLIWDVEKAAFNEDDNCFDIVLSCHPEEGEYLRKGEWEYHVSPKGELLPGTPLLRSSLRLKEEARKLSPLLLGAVAAVVLVVLLAMAAFAGGILGRGAAPAPTATPTVAAVVPPVAKPTPTATRVPTPVSGEQRFTLTIVQVGEGIVQQSPSPGPDGKYDRGVTVRLGVGVAIPGWVFTGFSGPVVTVDPGPNAIVVMDSDKAVTATFALEAVRLTPTPMSPTATPSPTPTPTPSPTPTPTPTQVPTVTGTYRGTITNLTAGQTAPFDLQLQESGATLSGYGRVYPPLVGEGPIRGQRTGNRVSFDTAYSYLGYSFIASFEGTVSSDYKTLSGTYRVSPTGEVGTWQVTRAG